MLRAAFIADDLTGANAVAAAVRTRGFRALTLLAPEQLSSFASSCPVLAIDANTRDLPAAAAYERVRSVAGQLAGAGFTPIGKRIDSTLRGNVGIEIDAVLDACPSGTFALVVAAVPELGRVTVGGYLLVDGAPLTETAAAADPWAAPRSSAVAQVIAAQSLYPVSRLTLDDLSGGIVGLQQRIRVLLSSGRKILVADATTGAHLDLLAGAVSDLPVAPVDPGPFSAALLQQQARGVNEVWPVLAVAGSITQRTRIQLDEALTEPQSVLVSLDAAALCGAGATEEVARGLAAALAIDQARVIVISSAHSEESVLDLAVTRMALGLQPEEAAARIATGLGAVTHGFLRSGRRVAGLYTTGGAVTQAVARQLQACAIDVQRAVLPLAVLGRLRGGPYDGLPLVSKGGLVGDHRAACRCIEALQAEGAAERPSL